MPWAIKWKSESKLNGKREFLIGLDGYTTIVFRLRKDARTFCKEKFGYIKTRKDLRSEPHGWKMPQVVKVEININIVE